MVAAEPTNQIGTRLPIRQTLVSGPSGSVAVLEVTVYTTGALFDIGVRSRGPVGLDGHFHWPLPDVSFEGINAELVIGGRGGHGGITDDGVMSRLDTFRYWLPLPSAPFRISVDWPHFGLSGSTRYFEPQLFQQAAARVLIPWQT